MSYLNALRNDQLSGKQINQVCEFIFKNIPINDISQYLQNHGLQKNTLFQFKLFEFQLRSANKIFDWQVALDNGKLISEKINKKILTLPTTYPEFVSNLSKYITYLAPSLLTSNQEVSEIDTDVETYKLMYKTRRLKDSQTIFDQLIQPALRKAVIREAQEEVIRETKQKYENARKLYGKNFLRNIKSLIENINWGELTLNSKKIVVEIKGKKIQMPFQVASIYQHCTQALTSKGEIKEAYRTIMNLAVLQLIY